MSKEIIQQIVNSLYPEDAQTEYLDAFLKSAVTNALAALEPFIPKWVDKEDQVPNYSDPVLLDDGENIFEGYYNHSNENYYDNVGRKVDIIRWQKAPDREHPYEQLLQSLKNSK